MSRELRPPRAWTWLLLLVLPGDIRQPVLGDLAEVHARMHGLGGRRPARRWYRHQARAALLPALRARLGGVLRNPELPSPSRGDGMIAAVLQDVRHALRSARLHPGFTLLVVFTLALGIAANTAMFSVVYGVLLSPLPYPDAERIGRLYNSDAATRLSRTALSRVEFVEYRENADMFEALAALDVYPVTITGIDVATRVRASFVSHDLFDVFSTPPLMGRTFTVDEDRVDSDVVVVSHAFWQSRLGADPQVLQRSVRVNGRDRQVIGVMPPTFDFYPGSLLWIPLGLDRTNVEAPEVLSHNLVAVAKLPAGADIEATLSAADAMMRSVIGRYPEHEDFHDAAFVPLDSWMTSGVRPTLTMLLGAVALLLAVGLTNVAGLLLSRTEVREREVALRTALGARRSRLVQQLLTESVVLALLGGALGVVLAFLLEGTVSAILADNVPRAGNVAINAPILIFSVLLSVVTGVLFGLAPTLRAGRTAPADALRSADRTGAAASGPMRSLLVTAEVALVVALLLGAGLMGRGWVDLLSVDPGIDPSAVLVFDVDAPETSYATHPEVAALFDRLAERLGSVAGVEAVGSVSWLPFAHFPSQWPVVLDGVEMPEETELPDYTLVTGDYFDAIGLPIVEGRGFRAGDEDDAAIVTELSAQLYWPGEAAIGKRLRLARNDAWRTVVGVVGDYRNRGLDTPPRQGVYFPYVPMNFGAEWFPRQMYFAVRSVDPATAMNMVRDAVASIDPELPVDNIRRMDVVLGQITSQPRLATLLLSVFAVLALGLGAVGIYGVVAQSVSRRAQEIGIRMALGARARGVLGMVLQESLRRVAAGLALGLLAGYWLREMLASGDLTAIAPFDVGTAAGVAVVLALVSVFATFVPALRAARMDPALALRGD